MSTQELIDQIRATDSFKELLQCTGSRSTTELGSLVGSAFSLVAGAAVVQIGGIHLFVMDDRDSAAYLCNDLYGVLDRERIYFFPTAFKRSIQFGTEDPSGIVQRTAALNAVKNFKDGYLVICTYPEAAVEKVVEMEQLRRSVLTVGVGDRLSIDFVEQNLVEYAFQRVDFVYEPGQYSIRGGILDVFSYSENKPFRLDFFGDEIDSIRSFDIASQLSVERLGQIEIVPNLKNSALTQNRVSLARFVGEATHWFADLDYTLRKFNDIRTKLLGEIDEPSQIDTYVTGRRAFLADTEERPFFLLTDKARERVAERRINFQTAPQPEFNKKFELLAEDIKSREQNGYKIYILSENKMQIERLDNIFHSIGEKNIRFTPLSLTLHAGFISHDLKACFYTDHGLFDRFHRYHIRGELNRSESLTIAELNSLKVGDYVTHIDHGVGRFGGLVRTVENGKTHEAIKLVYRDNDVLLVNVHALHRISRYKDKDSEPPKIYKLGSGAWQRMKSATKKAVKDIARELIALYSARKASQGFAFSPDTYLQHELEASFIYEDTPDQQTATEAVKQDMENSQPMDRLVCGDVGFGKTEIAIRAAFKAATDSKQVAVLVPTTILALQHYRSFSERMRDLPVRIEHLSRVKTTKEVNQIKQDLREGKIDILIGTHKILGKEIEFKSLGLLIVDEEQKFGVASKERLRQMKVSIDTLTLTATPIPRTLQFSLMGSRDLSVITTPPPNRQPIATESHAFDEQIIKEAIEFELSRGGQVYFVHNRVENIAKIEAMIKRLVPQARIAIGHGQMNPQQLEKIIMDFIYGEFDIFIATTIIENGIDIPNANTIIINNAQNFGLSDLHQLRGRVGRSNRKAYCYLLSPPDEMLSDDARRRLRAIEEFSDLGSGFNIAMQDLDIRGAGNLLGGEQSGFIADIGFETYQKILNEAMEEMRAEDGMAQAALAAAGNTGVATDATDLSAEGSQMIHAVGADGKSIVVQRISDDISYISDCHVEIDVEAYLPDSYVGQTVEKIRLYRELDNITSEEELRKFETNLVDRFGELPPAAKELLNVVRLRRFCIKLGFERVKVKNGLIIAQFVEDQSSMYYKSPLFMAIMKYISTQTSKFVFKQNNNKLTLTVRDVKNIAAAAEVLNLMWSKIIENQ